MLELNFRKLRADEIDCRVGSINDYGLTLLLYKDARVDQNILDETVGPYNWQRRHTRDNANCIVSLWDSEKKQWIEKEDVGTKSFAEEEKGLASDSFKRACFCWGIGRELYTAPLIRIKKEDYNVVIRGGKPTTYDRFEVVAIEYDEQGNIIKLAIKNEKTGRLVHRTGYKDDNEARRAWVSSHSRKKEIIKALKEQES